MLFLCCYYGVYPWRVLRPRSTKPAATELLHTSGACGSFACADKRINLRLGSSPDLDIRRVRVQHE